MLFQTFQDLQEQLGLHHQPRLETLRQKGLAWKPLFV